MFSGLQFSEETKTNDLGIEGSPTGHYNKACF